MNPTALYSLSYGLYAIGSLDGNRKVGCIANAVMQITSEPATVALSLNKGNYTHQCISRCGRFSVSILGEDETSGTIGTLGFSSSRDRDKFDELEHFDVDGLPVLKNAVAYITCKVLKTIDAGTHTIFVSEITDADNVNKKPPMTYAYYHRVLKGKAPKAAPTYQAELPEEEPAEKKYTCSICGYVYDDPAVPFESLPEDWKCPVCGVGKEMFVLK